MMTCVPARLALLCVLLAVVGCDGHIRGRRLIREDVPEGQDAGRWWDPGPEPDPAPGRDAGPDPDPDPVPDPIPDPIPDPSQPDAGPDPDPDPVPDPDPIPDPDPVPDPGSCTYPSASARLDTGTIISPYRWATAYTETGASAPFDLEDFYCRRGEWGTGAGATYHSILFVVGTGWCTNCPTYLRDVAAMNLEASGTLVVFLESQDESYRSATSRAARATVDRAVGSAPGLRIGDGENTPRDAIGDQTSTIPAGYFVRRSDMRVLADENQLGFTPNWEEMSANPELDWPSRFGRPAPGPCTEESHEPDDTRASAAAIAPGTLAGGICGPNDDFYAVSIPGRWRIDLTFSHAVGDIDLFALDASGRVIGTSDSADDDESLTMTGAATLRVLGYRGAQAPYRLTLTEL